VQNISISIQRTNAIKGLAILAVVLLHMLAYPYGIYNSNKQIFFISLDQLARFCMPAFIMLSGYGLAVKYGNEKIHYFKFLKKRIWKLLPLYLVWSFASIVIISSIPAWSFGNQPISLVTQMLLGQADYQLYYLPVIFQLYALFPLIWLFRKKANLVLIVALVIQIALFILYASKVTNSDRFEYVLSLSWIAYFVFGIYLRLKKLPNLLIKLAWPFGLSFFAVMAFSSLKQINAGIDPLPALKFTRLVVIPFGLFMNLALIVFKLPKESQSKKIMSSSLAWLGQNSYIIFLSHTIGLRIIYAIVKNQLPLGMLLGVIAAWIFTIFISQKMLGEKKIKPVINS
jgi:peptidoglycan/LPS O-acetylase OafA/YrhL